MKGNRNFKPGNNTDFYFRKIVENSERNKRKYSTRAEKTYWDMIIVG